MLTFSSYLDPITTIGVVAIGGLNQILILGVVSNFDHVIKRIDFAQFPMTVNPLSMALVKTICVADTLFFEVITNPNSTRNVTAPPVSTQHLGDTILPASCLCRLKGPS